MCTGKKTTKAMDKELWNSDEKNMWTQQNIGKSSLIIHLKINKA